MLFLIIALLSFNSSLLAQDFSFLSEHAPQTVFEIDQLFSPKGKLENKGDKSKLHFSNLAIGHTIKEGKGSVTIGGKFQRLNLSGDNPQLNDYANIQGSLGYRRMMDNGHFWFLSASYGSASDRPFKNSKDGTLGLNYIQKFSPRWYGVINYSNNRTFLNNIPLPGFFWVREMSREKALIIGFPFIYWMRPLIENWSFRYIGLMPWNHRLRLLYTKHKFFKPYFAFEQAPLSYFRHDRENMEDRFFWFEKRLAVGLEGGLSKALRFDLMSGIAFDRQLYEAENFNESKKFLQNLESHYFLGFNLKYSY
jgi:hypothetical protein